MLSDKKNVSLKGKNQKRIYRLKWGIFLLALVLSFYKYSGDQFSLRDTGFDLLQRLDTNTIGKESLKESPFLILQITNDSQKKIGIWPWPRHIFGLLNCHLKKSGAKAAMYDVYFGYAGHDNEINNFDSFSKCELLEDYPFKEDDRIGKSDRYFAKSMNLIPTYLASFPRRKLGAPVNYNYSFHRQDNGSIECYLDRFSFKNGSEPLGMFFENSVAPGNVLISPSSDGVLRTFPTLIKYGDSYRLSLFGLAVIEYLNKASPVKGIEQAGLSISEDPNYDCTDRLIGREGIRKITFKSQTNSEVENKKDISINTLLDGSIRLIEKTEVRSQQIELSDYLASPESYDISGKIVFIGVNDPGLDRDKSIGPLEKMRPGIQFQTMLAEQIVSGESLYESPYLDVFESVIVFIFIFILGFFVLSSRSNMAPIYAFFLSFIPLLLSFIFYRYFIILDGFLSFILIFIGLSISYMAVSVERKIEKDRYYSELRRFLPKGQAKRLVNQQNLNYSSSLELAKCAIMFIDIVGFSEKTKGFTPDQITNYIKQCRPIFVEEIHATGGILDKFLGDGVMALWKYDAEEQPNPASSALCTAKRIIERSKDFEFDTGNGICIGMPLRIGVHMDTVNIGFIYNEERLEFTALGSGVNFASRLEKLATPLKENLIISKSFYRELKNEPAHTFKFIEKIHTKVEIKGFGKHDFFGISF